MILQFFLITSYNLIRPIIVFALLLIITKKIKNLTLEHQNIFQGIESLPQTQIF